MESWDSVISKGRRVEGVSSAMLKHGSGSIYSYHLSSNLSFHYFNSKMVLIDLDRHKYWTLRDCSVRIYSSSCTCNSNAFSYSVTLKLAYWAHKKKLNKRHMSSRLIKCRNNCGDERTQLLLQRLRLLILPLLLLVLLLVTSTATITSTTTTITTTTSTQYYYYYYYY